MCYTSNKPVYYPWLVLSYMRKGHEESDFSIILSKSSLEPTFSVYLYLYAYLHTAQFSTKFHFFIDSVKLQHWCLEGNSITVDSLPKSC